VSNETPCPECGGKCCRADLGYRVQHMGAECYEHRCESCHDGTKYVAPLLLWLLTQSKERGFDTYDSCVVAAPTANAAKRIHPSGREVPSGWWRSLDWPSDPHDIEATLIGVADSSIAPGVVCASFNAG